MINSRKIPNRNTKHKIDIKTIRKQFFIKLYKIV